MKTTIKAYKAILSSKDEIKCDHDEIENIINGIRTGSMIKLRQGIINPSFLVAVIEDTERRADLERRIREAQEHNAQDAAYQGGRNQKAEPKLELLADILERHPAITAPNNSRAELSNKPSVPTT